MKATTQIRCGGKCFNSAEWKSFMIMYAITKKLQIWQTTAKVIMTKKLAQFCTHRVYVSRCTNFKHKCDYNTEITEMVESKVL